MSLSDFRQDLGVMGGVSCSPILTIGKNKVNGENLTIGIWHESDRSALLQKMRDIEKIISQRIRAILIDKKQNVSRLAEQTDLTTGYLSMLLNHKYDKRWNIDILDEVAKALDVPVWQLFVNPKDIVPAGTYELLAKYNKLDPDSKRIVDALLNTASAEPAKPEPKSHIKKGQKT